MFNTECNINNCCHGIFRILSTSNRSPIHLWNAIDGELEATYRVYDQYVYLYLYINYLETIKYTIRHTWHRYFPLSLSMV